MKTNRESIKKQQEFITQRKEELQKAGKNHDLFKLKKFQQIESRVKNDIQINLQIDELRPQNSGKKSSLRARPGSVRPATANYVKKNAALGRNNMPEEFGKQKVEGKGHKRFGSFSKG